MKQSQPLVSVLIAAYNEEAYLRDCVQSLLDSDIDSAKIEILIIDGASEDRTPQIAEELAREYSQIRVLQNPDRIVSAAMNIGARNARADILLRADTHALYDPQYLPLSLELLESTGAIAVGGRIIPAGRGSIGVAISDSLSLPISTGGASWRSGASAGPVETLWCGCWRKVDFERIGGFSEDWVRNQDAEFYARLSKGGGLLYFDPRIKATYFVRESLGALARQYFNYGWWRSKTLLAHPSTLKIRQVLPALFLLSLIAALALATVNSWPLLFLLCLYLAVVLVSILRLERLDFHVILIPVVVPIIHLAWGSGCLLSLLGSLFGAAGAPRKSQPEN